MSHSKVLISGVIITFNEERHIEACIKSLEGITDEVLVVDSYSTDKTQEICRNLGVKFIQHSFEGHIQQKNFAMQQATHDIVLSLDADERVSDEMKAAILELRANWQCDAHVFNRYNNYCGKWLKYAWYPDRKLRLWDRNKGKWGGVNPHDSVVIEKGATTQRHSANILHYAYENEKEHLSQIEKFARIAAREKHQRGKSVFYIWHLMLNPVYRFFSTYILKLGFIDGYYGFLYSKNAAYLNFLKYKYLWRLRKNK
ncbi:MAG: glycosyltransferase family 2 protein [Fulvivirga sp.]